MTIDLPLVVPLLRSPGLVEALRDAEALIASGATAIELTTTITGWPEALRQLVEAHDRVRFGLGTVRHADDVREAIDAGARFLVAPRSVPDAREAAAASGVPFVEGGLTLTELMAAAADSGWAKLFPAAALGPDYVRALVPVLGGTRLLVTGGVAPADAGTWLAAGAAAVGLSCDGPGGGDRYREAVASAGVA